MANAWKRTDNNRSTTKLLSPTFLFLLSLSFLLLLFFFFFTSHSTPPPSFSYYQNTLIPQQQYPPLKIKPFDCYSSKQANPIIGNVVEGLKYPFIYSLSDLGSLPDKPHKNIQRLLKKKAFRTPDISVTIQSVLDKFKGEGKMGIFIDVGANVGMASFAASVMGFRVFAFEPVFENLQRICEGVWFNRVTDLVTLFDAAASDSFGNITFHKVVGRLDNSAVSATGAKLAFKNNEEIAVEVKTIPLDEVIPASEHVLVLKIDVQGWEYHVLKGAKKLLSRKGVDAPYLIYEEDERLLQASNTTKNEIRAFLKSVGYDHCTQHGTDAHCTKKNG